MRTNTVIDYEKIKKGKACRKRCGGLQGHLGGPAAGGAGNRRRGYPWRNNDSLKGPVLLLRFLCPPFVQPACLCQCAWTMNIYGVAYVQGQKTAADASSVSRCLTCQTMWCRA